MRIRRKADHLSSKGSRCLAPDALGGLILRASLKTGFRGHLAAKIAALCLLVVCIIESGIKAVRFVSHRLQARGLKVLVERAVNRSEFPEFSAYNPELGGMELAPLCDSG